MASKGTRKDDTQRFARDVMDCPGDDSIKVEIDDEGITSEVLKRHNRHTSHGEYSADGHSRLSLHVDAHHAQAYRLLAERADSEDEEHV